METPETEAAADIEKLCRLVRRLRAPDGCPWDRKQTLADLRAYLLEEAHEAAAAIDAEDWQELAGEMGDLLFQVVFVSELGQEQGHFDLATVIDGIHHKMVERHPHVFGDESLDDASQVVRSWERRKAEKAAGRRSVLSGVATTLPALTASYRLTQKAAGVGFDWTEVQGVLDKVREELEEVEQCLHEDLPSVDPRLEEEQLRKGRLKEELGDLLFSVANLARHLEIDPEAALASGNAKFKRRFGAIEQALEAAGSSIVEADMETMEAGWRRVKASENASNKAPV